MAILLSYIAFNLLFGIFILMPYYFIREGAIKNAKEFILVSLFPTIGFGYWWHARQVRSGPQEDLLPKSWFVWRKMMLFHGAFMLVLFCLLVFGLFVASGFMGEGMDWAKDQDNPAAWGFGAIWDLGAGVALTLVALALFFLLGIVGLVLILAPFIFSNSIRSNQLKLQLIRMRHASMNTEDAVNIDDTKDPDDPTTDHNKWTSNYPG